MVVLYSCSSCDLCFLIRTNSCEHEQASTRLNFASRSWSRAKVKSCAQLKILMDHSSPLNDFGNAKSQPAKKAPLAGHVTISKELCQFNSTLTITERRVRFKFHRTLIAQGLDSAARPDYFETIHSISVIYALNCRSRKRSFGGKFF